MAIYHSELYKFVGDARDYIYVAPNTTLPAFMP